MIPLAMIEAQEAEPELLAPAEPAAPSQPELPAPAEPTATDEPEIVLPEPKNPIDPLVIEKNPQSWSALFSDKLHTTLLNSTEFRDLIGDGDVEKAKRNLLFVVPIEPGLVYAVTHTNGVLGWDWPRKKRRGQIAIDVNPATQFRHRGNRLYLLSATAHPVCLKLARSGGVVDWDGAAPDKISTHQLKTAQRDLFDLNAPAVPDKENQLKLIKALLLNENPPQIKSAQSRVTTISLSPQADTNYTAYVRDGRLYCKSNDPDKHGFTISLTSKENPFQPVVRNGRVYYANDVDRFVCWDIKNRDLLWKYDGAFAPDNIPYQADLSLAFLELHGRPPQSHAPRSLLAHVRAYLRKPANLNGDAMTAARPILDPDGNSYRVRIASNEPDPIPSTIDNPGATFGDTKQRGNALPPPSPNRIALSLAGVVQGWSIHSNRLHFTHPTTRDSPRDLWSWYHDDVDGAYGVTEKDGRVYIVDGRQNSNASR